jgi:HlyD family secretion protein
MAESKIFRKVALERLSSPEQLDQLMQVTNAKGWLSLATIGVLLLLATIWSIVGSIPDRVPGQAMLLRSGGVFEVVSQSSGRVTDLPLRVGDTISEGQVVARLAQPELSEQVRQARARVAELTAQHERTTALLRHDAELQAEAIAARRTNIELTIAATEATVANLHEKLSTQERLTAQGLLTKQTMLVTRQEYEAARERIRTSRAELSNLDVQSLQSRSQQQQQLGVNANQLHEATRELTRLESSLALESTVTSPYSGQVLEMMAEQGSIVERGKAILTISLAGRMVKSLEAVVYVPSMHGKKLRPGMEIQIMPSTVKREQYGYLLGRVTYVSDFPATPQGMQRVLKNSMLVQALSQQDAPYEVHADLIPDAANASRYRWSSSQGPPTALQSGTLATASIVVSRRRPILLVIPQLAQRFGTSVRVDSSVARSVSAQ